jgi:hypothetical protein
MSIIRRLVLIVLVATALAAVPRSPANAQQWDCSFPLAWPFCIAGAAVYTAGAIVAALFHPYYYSPGYYSPGYAYPAYYAPGYYYPHYHHYHHHHHARHHYY